MALPKTVENIFQTYENRTDWTHGELERDICNSSMGKSRSWTYQNVKSWVKDGRTRFPNVARIYVNSLYHTHRNLPCELNDLSDLIEK